jgi:cyclophilin family peptidyl-prolyl cis-trans isomerase
MFTTVAPILFLLAGATSAPQDSRPASREVAATSDEAAKTSTADPVKEIDDFIAKQKESQKLSTSKPNWKTSMPRPPKLTFDAKKDYFWNLTTNKGDVKIKLMPGVAPMHVSSTMYLVRTGFYDDLTFHRVISGFMAQGGCPLGRGTGNPGYKYDGEYDRKVKHDRPFLLSMANAGPGTDGSQFFLTFVPTPHLNGKHTIFGEVVEGQKVVRALEAQGSPRGATKEPLLMVKSTISVEDKPAKAKEESGS